MNQSKSQYITETINDSVLEISFNRPERKNALTLDMYDHLASTLETADQTSKIKVVILTGKGDAFTSGNDLIDFMKSPPTNLDTPVFRFLKSLIHFSKPLMAAINGAAIGIGTTMLLHCDFAYAASSATFQLPFIRLGLVPEAGASLLLPKMLGHRRAAELLMIGDIFLAPEAKALGIINDHFPADQLLTLAREKAQVLASLPPKAMRETKTLLKRADHKLLKQTMMIEGDIFMKSLGSPENQEAFQAFFDKRAPDFSQFS